MVRPTPTHRVRGAALRRAALASLAAAAVSVACNDVVAPPRAAPRVPTLDAPRHNSVTTPSTTLTAELKDGDSKVGSGNVTLGTFANPTVVKAVASGFVTQRSYGSTSGGVAVDPGGYATCDASDEVRFTLGSFSFCDINNSKTQLVETWTKYTKVQGAGYAFRAGGPTPFSNANQCNQAAYPPCFSFQGTQTVTLTSVPVALTFTASRRSVLRGDTVTFMLTMSPMTVGSPSEGGTVPIPYSFSTPTWVPDSGASTVTACPATLGAACKRVMTQSGTMTYQAIINGSPVTVLEHVSVVPCLVGDPATRETRQSDTLLNDSRLRRMAKLALDSSYKSSNPFQRVERKFGRLRRADGSIVDTLLPIIPPDTNPATFTLGDGPCHSTFPEAPAGAKWLVRGHGHPFDPSNNNDVLPYDPYGTPKSNCLGVLDYLDENNGYYPPNGLKSLAGLSTSDRDFAGQEGHWDAPLMAVDPIGTSVLEESGSFYGPFGPERRYKRSGVCDPLRY